MLIPGGIAVFSDVSAMTRLMKMTEAELTAFERNATHGEFPEWLPKADRSSAHFYAESRLANKWYAERRART